MKLIFKATEFPTYIDEFLPFLDRDTKYIYIKPHIISAQKEIEKVIGIETFALAIKAFESENTTALEKEILYHFRLPILLYAYKIYAPSSDLRHGNNGRKMTKKEDEANPFEWMINRDNENLERGYYREFDNLIFFLNKFNVWQESDTYKKMRSLFVHSTTIFDDHFPVNSRLLLLKIQPGLKQAERKHIHSIVGQQLFFKLKAYIQQSEVQDLEYYPGEAPGQEQEVEGDPITLQPLEEEVLKLTEEACVYFSMAWAMKRLKVTLFPEGLLQSYVGDRNTLKARKTPENLETQLVAQEFTKDGEDVLILIQNKIAELNVGNQEEATNMEEFHLKSEVKHDDNDISFTI
jgi:hypothetical protein